MLVVLVALSVVAVAAVVMVEVLPSQPRSQVRRGVAGGAGTVERVMMIGRRGSGRSEKARIGSRMKKA